MTGRADGSRMTGRRGALVAAGAAAAGVVTVAMLWRRMSPGDPGRARDEPPVEPAVLARLADWVPARPRTRPGRVVAYAWASPLTLIGCLLGWLSRADVRVGDGVVLFTAARGPMGALLRRRGFAATTLGHAIVTTAASPSPGLLAHELVHTRQAERLGVLFGPVYVALLGRYGYRQHPFERAARRAPRATGGRGAGTC